MEQENTLFLDVIEKAIGVPGVKVNRDEYLMKVFENEDAETKNIILKEGPIKAGIERKKLNRIAKKIVNNHTIATSTASFAAGLPGGLAMAGTIPADMIQFYGVALRLIQKLAFLYGDEEMLSIEDLHSKKAINRIVIYCGVMFGVSGSVATLKLTTSLLAKQAVKKIPQMALTKTVYYPIIKKVVLNLGLKMNKDLFAKSVGKVIPVIGGVVSGGLTFASMRPGGMRIVEALDDAMFEYSSDEINRDINKVIKIIDEDAQNIKDVEYEDIESAYDNKEDEIKEKKPSDLVSKIKEAKQLLDEGLITDDEFGKIKEKLINEM